MVGATGFEPATTCTPSKCATRLRYAPALPRQLWGFQGAGEGGGSITRPARRQREPEPVAADRAALRFSEMRSGAVRGIQRVLQHLRGAEGQHAPRADLDLLAGLGVAAHAGALLADDEVAEAGELDLLALLERVLDGVEHHLDDLGALLLGEPDFLAHALDHVGLGHGKDDSRTDKGESKQRVKLSSSAPTPTFTCLHPFGVGGCAVECAKRPRRRPRAGHPARTMRARLVLPARADDAPRSNANPLARGRGL